MAEEPLMVHLTAILTSWPGPIAIVIIAVAAIFYRPITRLLDRTRHVRAPGAQLDATGQHPQEQPVPTEALLRSESGKEPPPGRDARTAADALLQQLPRSDYITAREKWLDGVLTEQGISNDAHEMARVLRAVAAVAAVSTELERVYSTIYGSQVGILEALNSHGLLPAAQLRLFYDDAVSRYPDTYKGYSFDQYLSFLTTSALAVSEGANLRITLKGRTLLLYLVQEGKPPRPG